MLKVNRLFLLMAVLTMVLAACGGSSTPAAAPTTAPTEEIAPTEAPTEEVTAEATVETVVEATEEAEVTVEATQEAVVDEIVGDPAKGQELFNEFRSEVNFACATCHYPDKEEQLVGPGMLGLAERAATRVEGLSATEYLRNSIMHPSEYIVEGFPDLLMPQVYADLFTEEQINNLIAYLKTL